MYTVSVVASTNDATVIMGMMAEYLQNGISSSSQVTFVGYCTLHITG